jgi:predicted Kef-type K+ transport protein
MDAVLLAIAFFFGLLAQQLRLPPLVGFLVSGFVLQAFGKTGGDTLETITNLGVTLMLFSIGVKLRVRTLARPEIWAGTSLHTLAVLLVFTPTLVGVGALIGRTAGLDWSQALLVAFALSFSSTVFAVKSLGESGDMGAMHGRIAIGMLIMQDILAVLFLTFSTGKIPTLWAIPLLVVLLVGRKWVRDLIGRSGHGEMIALCGLFLALVVGAEGFSVVGLKADLGALFVGVLVGSHPKAKELSKSLVGLTDLLLVGFFLQIGLQGSLSLEAVLWSLLLLCLLPLKSLAFFFLLTRFHLRARTAWMSGLTLSTYSEFGLIVLALAVGKDWISSDWLVAMALSLSASILILAPLTRKADQLYDPISDFLKRFETKGQHPDDLPIQTAGERIAIFGMGRVGIAAYRSLKEYFPGKVIGFDRDPAAVEIHQEAGRNVLLADATDSDFWERVSVKENIDLVVLAMPKHGANVHAAEALKRHNFEGVVAATGKFDDDVRELRILGLDTAFNLYSEAGSGFANHVLQVFNQQRPDLASHWRRQEERDEPGE